MSHLDVAAQALLLAEWNGGTVGRVRHCPVCRGAERHGKDFDGFDLGDGTCFLDRALTDIGFRTQQQREGAREMLKLGEPPWPTMELLASRRSPWEILGDCSRDPNAPPEVRELLKQALESLRRNAQG